MIAKLESLDFLNVFPSQANYIMCEVKGMKAHELCVELLKRNILIKDLSNKDGIRGEFIRIAVRTKEENNILYQAFLEEGEKLHARKSLESNMG